MNIRNIFFLALCALTFTACGGDDDNDNNDDGVVRNTNCNDSILKKKPSLPREITRLEFPRVKTDGHNLVVVHKTSDKYDPQGVNYSLEWDCNKKSSRWVAYMMHKATGVTGRTDAWAEDPDIPSSYRFNDTNYMYKGSGFTRGHICGSADRLYSVEANRQTFYYSNMQPQYYNFNAGDDYSGVWVKMESQVRTWANQTSKDAKGNYIPDTLYVVKGGTIDRENQILMRIKGELIVPRYFFMAILCKYAGGYRALGFWAEHNSEQGMNYYANVFGKKASDITLSDFVVNIDELEELTGLDFFCNLPDNIEDKIEKLPADNVRRIWGLSK